MEVKRYENDELHIVLKNPYTPQERMIRNNGISAQYPVVNQTDRSTNRNPDRNPNLSRNSSLRKATTNSHYIQ